MFIELVDILRCVRPHEETWLVATADRMAGRSIVEGVLGCHVCRAQYPIVDGVAHFEGGDSRERSGERANAGTGDPARVLRAAALLGLDEPGGVVLLGGSWGGLGESLLETADAQFILLDPPAGLEVREGLSGLAVGGTLPIAASSLRAAALDARTSTPSLVRGTVRALVAGARIVAPAAVAVPAGIRELARDEADWVGERDAAPSRAVPLRRAR